eukprot:gb/GECG01011864.1/.p1 GENE.gb/GECG01011864.1/~~gb/GECG01011864.1/.p1  ORF type:complete len:1010 (+),score=146.04 gb/GECG01011864.1/:1-3030(+)
MAEKSSSEAKPRDKSAHATAQEEHYARSKPMDDKGMKQNAAKGSSSDTTSPSTSGGRRRSVAPIRYREDSVQGGDDFQAAQALHSMMSQNEGSDGQTLDTESNNGQESIHDDPGKKGVAKKRTQKKRSEKNASSSDTGKTESTTTPKKRRKTSGKQKQATPSDKENGTNHEANGAPAGSTVSSLSLTLSRSTGEKSRTIDGQRTSTARTRTANSGPYSSFREYHPILKLIPHGRWIAGTSPTGNNEQLVSVDKSQLMASVVLCHMSRLQRPHLTEDMERRHADHLAELLESDDYAHAGFPRIDEITESLTEHLKKVVRSSYRGAESLKRLEKIGLKQRIRKAHERELRKVRSDNRLTSYFDVFVNTFCCLVSEVRQSCPSENYSNLLKRTLEQQKLSPSEIGTIVGVLSSIKIPPSGEDRLFQLFSSFGEMKRKIEIVLRRILLDASKVAELAKKSPTQVLHDAVNESTGLFEACLSGSFSKHLPIMPQLAMEIKNVKFSTIVSLQCIENDLDEVYRSDEEPVAIPTVLPNGFASSSTVASVGMFARTARNAIENDECSNGNWFSKFEQLKIPLDEAEEHVKNFINDTLGESYRPDCLDPLYIAKSIDLESGLAQEGDLASGKDIGRLLEKLGIKVYRKEFMKYFGLFCFQGFDHLEGAFKGTTFPSEEALCLAENLLTSRESYGSADRVRIREECPVPTVTGKDLIHILKLNLKETSLLLRKFYVFSRAIVASTCLEEGGKHYRQAAWDLEKTIKSTLTATEGSTEDAERGLSSQSQVKASVATALTEIGTLADSPVSASSPLSASATSALDRGKNTIQSQSTTVSTSVSFQNDSTTKPTGGTDDPKREVDRTGVMKALTAEPLFNQYWRFSIPKTINGHLIQTLNPAGMRRHGVVACLRCKAVILFGKVDISSVQKSKESVLYTPNDSSQEASEVIEAYYDEECRKKEKTANDITSIEQVKPAFNLYSGKLSWSVAQALTNQLQAKLTSGRKNKGKSLSHWTRQGSY